MSRLVASLLVVAVAVAGAASPALAFRPSSKWLLDKVMERAIDRGTKSIKADADVVVYDANGKPQGASIEETVTLSSPGLLRRETTQEGSVLVEIRADGKLIVRAQGQAEKTQKAGVDLLADIMTASPPTDAGVAADKLIAAFKGLGVNTEVVSYARFDGRVAYLIGSKPWETDKPQVWIEKDTFLPMRVVTFVKGEKLDLRYLGWGSPVGGAWYPQSIEIWKNDKLVRRAATQTVERNLAVDATLFK